jgi:hypothetical protein
MKKPISELIDSLSVTNIKIFMLVEKVEREENTAADAQKMQKLIKLRSKLMGAIEEELGGENDYIKVYSSDK